MILGHLIREWRYAQKRSINAVAQEIGVATSTLKNFENGDRVSVKEFSKILQWVLKEDR